LQWTRRVFPLLLTTASPWSSLFLTPNCKQRENQKQKEPINAKTKKRNQPNITLQKKCYTSWNKADFFAKDTLLLHRNKSGKQYPIVYISLKKITPVHQNHHRDRKGGEFVPLLGTWTERLRDEDDDTAFNWAISYWPFIFWWVYDNSLYLSRSLLLQQPFACFVLYVKTKPVVFKV
jgi:hypothetical protein